MFLSKNKMGRKALSVMLAAAMVSSVAVTSAVTTSAATVTAETSNVAVDTTVSNANQYGLKDNVQDGVILHAWQWSFNNIKAKLPEIAAAGYTAVQTSVAQRSKEATAGKTNEVWWLYYQPAAFEIDNTGNSALGTKADLQALCTEADKYGIKVIVDVVANHLGNQSGYDLSSAIPDDIKNDSSCWHSEGFTEINYGDRYSITHGSMGGLPDLNTESTKIQNYVLNYLKECIDVGVDGFRFDAAKHIGVPSEGSNFWPTVINGTTSYAQSSKGITPYYYGEILDSTGGPAITEYTTYMSVTDNQASNGIRGSVAGGNATGAASSYYNKGAAANKTVLWAESHDTYSNENKESTYVSDSNINKTWAMVGSRNNATALYFARTNGYRGGNIGQIYSTQCFNKEVAEVNKFHNYFAGQSEYLASSGSIAYNERGTEGVVLVNCGGTSTSVSVKANKMKDGTYKDQVSGNTFTVSGGTISGQIGSTGIAVVYNAVPQSGISATPGTQGGTYKYKTDTLTVTLNATNVTNATYSLDGGSATSFTDGQTITIGSGKAFETSQTLTLTATNSSGSAVTATYTFYKTNQGTTIYFDNSSYNWSKVYAYIYTGDGETAQAIAAWPGVQLTNKSSTSGYYYYDLPDGYEDARVIFSDGVDGTTNRYPADMEPGLEVSGTSHLFSSGNSWKEYSESNVTTNPTSATTPITGTSYYKGDADGNNKVNLKDCSVIQKALVGLTTLTDTGKLAADVNGDGDITLADVLSVMRYLVGMTNTYNVGTLVQGTTPVNPTSPTSTTDPTVATETPTSTPTSTPISSNTLYFNDAAIAVGNERYCVYVWDGNGGEQFIDMTSAGSNLYQVTIPSGYSNVIIMRMNGETTENSWTNCWNQTDDLTFSSSQNLFTATGWGSDNKFTVSASSSGDIVVTPTNPTETPTSTPVSSNTLYFNDAAIAVGNERYCVYTWDGNGGEQFIDMTSAGSNLYQATIPNGYSNVIIMRMNGSTTENNWGNCWNQTDDLTFSSSQNMFTATGWGSNGRFNVTISSK